MEVYLTCRSLTFASRTLSAARIRNMIVRTPQNMSREGCGYAVRIAAGALETALGALDAAMLTPKRIFRRLPAGGFEEVKR